MKKSSSFTQLSLCLWLGMMAGGLSACNPQKKANSNQLEFWTMQLKPTFTEYFTNINQTFEEQNKAVKLRWVDVSWSAMENNLG
jgi:putative chitobiose transport system substrate-binding protein